MNFNIPYLVGDMVGRDHQYWPTILRSEIPFLTAAPLPARYDSIWPVDITLEQLLALTWRVRNWDFSGSCAVSKTIQNAGDPAVFTQSGSADVAETQLTVLKLRQSDSALIASDKEPDIIRRFVIQGYKASSFTGLANYSIGAVTGDAPISAWESSGDFGTFSGSTPPANTPGEDAMAPSVLSGFPILYNPTTQMFSPPFAGIGEMIPFIFGGSPLVASVQFLRNPATVLSGTGPLTLRKPGVMSIALGGIAPDFDVPVELQWRFTGESPGSHVSGTGDCDFTLEATDWWPFKNSLGQLVYAADDGAQQNDPFA